MSKAELTARNEVQQAERGRFSPTLEDGMRWEALGLGRVFFEGGVPRWYRDEAAFSEAA